MKEENCGVVPVVDQDMHVKGIVTDRDITLFTVLQHKDPETTKLGEFMSKDVITCLDEEDFDDLVTRMKEYQVRRIPIVNKENKLVGMVSLGDVAVKAPQEEHEVYEALERISEPVHSY
ncbi:MAG: hypothetical protein A2Y25_03020 [Candidatus Melainabacteria bacterium GWF2_37_15]|nr:MAG: hypothetical protein A2Y25_03020 [Candidatus Melainabacteria bacterium GWF2_37_15]